MNWLVSNYNDKLLDSIKNDFFPLSELANEASFKTKKLQEFYQEAIITNDENELDLAEDLANNILQTLQLIKSKETEKVQRAEQLRIKFISYKENSLTLVSGLMKENKDLGEMGKEIKEMQESFVAFSNELEVYQKYRTKVFNDAIQTAKSRSENNIILGFATLGFGIIITIMMMISTKAYISNPIYSLAKASKLMATGQFPEPVEAKTKDELGVLIRQFNKMLGSIQENQGKLEFLIDNSRSISRTTSLLEFGRLIHELFDALIDEPVSIYLTSDNFIDLNKEEDHDHYYLTANGGISPSEPHFSETHKQSLILDPKTSTILARLYFQCNDAKFEEIKPILDALSSSIANSLSSIKLEQAMSLINAKNQQINAIFEAVPQGICLVNDRLQITGEPSAHLSKIVGDLDEKTPYPIIKYLFSDAELYSSINSVFQASIGEDPIFFEMNKHLLPTFSKIKWPQAKELEIDWQFIESNSVVDSIMLSIRDVTDLRELQRKTEQKTDEVAAIKQIIDIDARSFRDYITLCEELRNEYQHRNKENLPIIKRHLHTLKGNGRLIGLREIPDLIHGIEDIIDVQFEDDFMRPLFLKIEAYVSLYKKFREQKSGIKEHSVKSLRNAYNYVKDLSQDGGNSKNFLIIEDLLFSRAGKNIHGILEEIGKGAERASLEEGTPKPDISVHNDLNIVIESSILQNLLGCLNHLANNAVAHGLSNIQGAIHMTTHLDASHLVIELWDTGKGLNLNKLQEKASAEARELPDRDIGNLIFIQDTSTKSSTSTIAGRGVGMAAAKELLDDIGGSLDYEFTSPKNSDGFRPIKFVVKVPRDYLFESYRDFQQLKASS